MAGTMETEDSTRVDLKGSPANPARDPKKMTQADKQQPGNIALNDALIIIGVAWVFVLFISFSLRHYNV